MDSTPPNYRRLTHSELIEYNIFLKYVDIRLEKAADNDVSITETIFQVLSQS